MNNLGFLGIGQGGSNIADVASRNGFYSCAINYSSRDLASLQYIGEENQLGLIGSEGVGKDRNQAIKLMNSNWDLATNFVKEHFSHPSIEVIFVPFSTAGGSGSGVSPVLLSMLTELMPNKSFVALPIIPDNTEVHKSLTNCLEAFEDLSKLDIAILPIDNEQTRTATNNVGRVGLYRNTNEKVVKLIKDIIDYTELPSQYSVLDRKDFLSIFKTKGFSTIAEVNITNLSNGFELSTSSFAEKIQNSWDKSPFAKIERDQVVSAGIIFDGQERLIDCLDIRKVFSEFENGVPLNLFEGIYVQNTGGKVISILSGLSLCRSRLKEIEKLVEDNQKSITNLNNRNLYVANVTSPTHQEIEVKKQPTVKDISNLISKFRR